MKRKTNLFYTSGDDNKFITFSNYGESLTGNFLATDWKLYPSRFLCMYIKALDVVNEEIVSTTSSPIITTTLTPTGTVTPTPETPNFEKRKKNFIKYLTSSYENKLAYLRDYCTENNINVEKTIIPLNYLLESIYLSKVQDDNTFTMDDYNNLETNNVDKRITFVGDITEQDYNGIYADSIFVINSSDITKGNIELNDNFEKDVIKYNDSQPGMLYGWSNDRGQYIGLEEYRTEHPYFNEVSSTNEPEYYINSKIKYITNDTHIGSPNIKFNIIIPLYDLVNINKNNNDTIVEENNNTTNIEIDLTDTSKNYIKNVPLGIWFAEEPIELKRDNQTGYAPSWSLLLSSQFKPFPYSQKMPNEIKQDDTKEAFATFSQVLVRQNRLLDKLDEMNTTISILSNRINEMEGKMNTSTSYSLDGLYKELINFENTQKIKFESFKEEIYSYVVNKWKGYIS